LYKRNSSSDWRWYENILSYENWRLVEPLFEAHLLGEDCLDVAEESLEFLISVEFDKAMLIPVGSDGWYRRNQAKAEFDELPVEAGSAVETLTTAAMTVNSKRYRNLALQAFKWYHGSNRNRAVVYDRRSGACYDGLSSSGLNLNQGAESTLSYLLAATRLREILR
jgi:hypothetical protein